MPLLIASGIFGFFFMAAAPLGYQYAAELSHPAPESTSQGLIVLSGQLSGIVFIVLGSVNLVLAIKMKESSMIRSDG